MNYEFAVDILVCLYLFCPHSAGFVAFLSDDYQKCNKTNPLGSKTGTSVFSPMFGILATSSHLIAVIAARQHKSQRHSHTHMTGMAPGSQRDTVWVQPSANVCVCVCEIAWQEASDLPRLMGLSLFEDQQWPPWMRWAPWKRWFIL